MPQATGPLNPPACIANDSTPKQQEHSDNLTLKVGLPTQKSRQTSKQTSRSKDEHRSVPNQATRNCPRPLSTKLPPISHWMTMLTHMLLAMM